MFSFVAVTINTETYYIAYTLNAHRNEQQCCIKVNEVEYKQ